MSDLRPAPTTDRPASSRRRFLALTGAGVAGASLLSMLDARQAPAQIKGTSLRLLTWSHFVPAYDAWFDEFAKMWGEQNGVKGRVDHIPHLELPARYAAEFAAGAGHDLIYFAGQILTVQYYRNLVDVSDLADGLGKKYGGWLDAAKSAAQVSGAWWDIVGRHFTGTVNPFVVDGNLVYNWEDGKWHPFVTGGVGLYHFNSHIDPSLEGGDTNFGGDFSFEGE